MIDSTLMHESLGLDLTDIHRLANISVSSFGSLFSIKFCMA